MLVIHFDGDSEDLKYVHTTQSNQAPAVALRDQNQMLRASNCEIVENIVLVGSNQNLAKIKESNRVNNRGTPTKKN